MPTYCYRCSVCDRPDEAFRHVADRHDGPPCCGKRMTIEIRPAYVQCDLPGYQSPVSGQWIEGRAARRDDLARTQSRPWEGLAAEREQASRNEQHREAKADAKIDAAARRAYSELSPAKRRILEQGT